MQDRQCGDKAGTMGRNLVEVQVRPWPSHTDRLQARRNRVLALIAQRSQYARGPGKPWWALRQELSGRVTAAELREILDQLLEDELVVELWLSPPYRRQPAHRFMRVDAWPDDWGGWNVLHARGDPDLLQKLGLL